MSQSDQDASVENIATDENTEAAVVSEENPDTDLAAANVDIAENTLQPEVDQADPQSDLKADSTAGQPADTHADGEQAVQQELPLAFVNGEPMTAWPHDLFIPPDALEVFLEAFEGPLDLLLYLIRKQNLDILNIPIAEVTKQYMAYVDLMKDMRLELAGEYLVMAAMLAEIKSRFLLPRQIKDDEEEEDPRAELVRRLQEYEQFKKAAQDIDELPRQGRDVFNASVVMPDVDKELVYPEVSLDELLHSLSELLQRAELFTSHQIKHETLSVRERMSILLERLSDQEFTEFQTLFLPEEGRPGIVVTFLAMMELIKEGLVELVQQAAFAPIHLRIRVS
ncbi:segregation and condensation protein A [Pelagibaculum spongiae]|uniref:Segregation and condensation protein A n=1 Tax=Pelagibaculum spongiae TaxID=2080658 RepID=A0A2V1H4E1_9GAMM|nr:ScpA family protein [Pelagibaculum spongiae]PVZ71645.1 segregation/condensation protein A [Pelagibaculum spongiae]